MKNYFLSLSPILFMLFSGFLTTGCDARQAPDSGNTVERVQTGAELLLEHHLGELDGLNVGLVMNPTARIEDTHMLDTLLVRGVEVTALYAPEHGFRGEAGAGEVIEDGVDQATGLPVYSLYGETRKPTGEMLAGVDLLLFDMQDVGVRFYTYNATLGLILEAASEHGVAVWVLDRPNPLGGAYVSGWILEEEYRSFVGMYPIPVAHGMTLGELGRMIVGEEWVDLPQVPEFRVIEMEGWTREMRWPETGLEWVPPSPNLPTFEHAFVYPGTCFIEGTTLSEGRGTEHPFLLLGSPETEFDETDLNRLREQVPGLKLSAAEFTPESIPGVAAAPKHEGVRCSGIEIRVADYDLSDPVIAGLRITSFLLEQTPGAETNEYLYRLTGTRQIDEALDGSWQSWEFDLESFKELREPYLIY